MKSIRVIGIMLAVLISLTSINGCEDQPIGYVFEPTERNQSTVARTAADIVNALYVHTDQAVDFLEKASLTSDYQTLLPGGWQGVNLVDTTTGDPYTLYQRNYLDQNYYYLRFDRETDPAAVRTPSLLDYYFLEIGSFRDPIRNNFYGGASEVRLLTVEYADDRTDPEAVDGWFEIRRVIPIKTVKETYFVSVTWHIRLIGFTVDPENHRANLSIDGIMPLKDEAGDLHSFHVSGEFSMNRDGSGSGEMWLFGQPAARLFFTHRAFGFEGYYRLADENYEKRYKLDIE